MLKKKCSERLDIICYIKVKHINECNISIVEREIKSSKDAGWISLESRD